MFASRGGYSDIPQSSTGTIAAYQKDCIKLPSVGSGGIDITSVAPPDLAVSLVDGSGILFDTLHGDVPPVASLAHRPALVFESKLRQKRHDYGEALGTFATAGVIERASQPPQGEVGMLFVRSKDNLLRLNFDPRRVNAAQFRPPPHTHLPSPASLASIESPACHRLDVAAADVEVCFYQYLAPTWLRARFALPPICKYYLPHHAQKLFLGVARDGLCQFWVRVLPMGWSWAVYVVQHCQQFILQDALHSAPWVLDKRPVGVVGPQGHNVVRSLCIDNFAALSWSSTVAHKGMLGEFKQRALPQSWIHLTRPMS